MQLFVIDYTKKGETIIIADSDLLSQIRKVLRVRIGDTIWIQNPEYEHTKTRYEIRIDMWDNKTLEWTIISKHYHESITTTKSMIIALPNKRDKIELIVQKLTECWLDQIVFWPAERSIIKDWNPKKEERLRKIMKEAVEQSRWRKMPELHFAKDIKTYIQDGAIIIFDKTSIHGNTWGTRNKGQVTGVVGPEWWLTPKDYELFSAKNPEIRSLWDTVLRIETAAIIWGWIVKNT